MKSLLKTYARLKRKARRRIKADNGVDQWGTPILGDAPSNQEVNDQVGGNTANGATQTDTAPAVDAQETTTNTAPAVNTAPVANPSVNTVMSPEQEATVILKLKETLNKLQEEQQVNKEVAKTLTQVLQDAGITVAAFKRAAKKVPLKISASAKKKIISTVAKLEAAYKEKVEKYEPPKKIREEVLQKVEAIRSDIANKMDRLLAQTATLVDDDYFDDELLFGLLGDVERDLYYWDGLVRLMEELEEMFFIIKDMMYMASEGAINYSDFEDMYYMLYSLPASARKKVVAEKISEVQATNGISSGNISSGFSFGGEDDIIKKGLMQDL